MIFFSLSVSVRVILRPAFADVWHLRMAACPFDGMLLCGFGLAACFFMQAARSATEKGTVSSIGFDYSGLGAPVAVCTLVFGTAAAAAAHPKKRQS